MSKLTNNEPLAEHGAHSFSSERGKGIYVSPATLEALRGGSHEAFERVFVAYFEKVKYFIAVLVKSQDLAEELAQELFTNLWEHHDRVDPLRNFNSYIYTIARNSVYNYAKSCSVRNRYAQTLEEGFSPAEAEEIMEAKETELLVSLAVKRMPLQRRRIFELSREKGLSNEEIARQLSITRNAVDKQLRLALADVRSCMATSAQAESAAVTG